MIMKLKKILEFPSILAFYLKTSNILKYFSMAFIITGIFGLILKLPLNEGDSSIYLVYAKDMWKAPFTYGHEVKSGATSPIWAMILSLFFIFPIYDLNLHIYFIKCFALIIVIICGYVLKKLSLEITKNENISWMCMAVFLNNYYLTGNFIMFETVFASLSIMLAILCTIKIIRENQGFHFRDYIIAGLIIGSLHYIRPEALLITIILTIVLIHHLIKNKLFKPNLKRIFIISFIMIFCLSWYYIYFFIMTKELPFSSLFARSNMVAYHRGEDIYFTPLYVYYAFIGFNEPFLEVFNFLFKTSINGDHWIVFGIWNNEYLIYFLRTVFLSIGFIIGIKYLIKNNKSRNQKEVLITLFSSFSFLILFLIFNPGGYGARYLFPIKPLNIIFVITGIYYLWKKIGRRFLKKVNINKENFQIFTVLIIISLGVLYIPIQTYDNYQTSINSDINVDINDTLGKKHIEKINKYVDEDDTVLLYEIQNQYYLEAQAISMDGIVGGEILPYLYGEKKGDLTQFLLDYEIDFIVSGDIDTERRTEYKDTILIEIYDRAKHSDINDDFTINGIHFENLMEHENSYLVKVDYN